MDPPQSFWHLTSMRHFLLHVEIKDESRTVESNVLRALRVRFILQQLLRYL